MKLTNPIITIEEARKVLGTEANAMTDFDIETLIEDMDSLARLLVRRTVLKANKSHSIKQKKGS